MELDTKYKRPNIKSDPDGYESGPYVPVSQLQSRGVRVEVADIVCIVATRKEMGPVRKYTQPDLIAATPFNSDGRAVRAPRKIRTDHHGIPIFVAPGNGKKGVPSR